MAPFPGLLLNAANRRHLICFLWSGAMSSHLMRPSLAKIVTWDFSPNGLILWITDSACEKVGQPFVPYAADNIAMKP